MRAEHMPRDHDKLEVCSDGKPITRMSSISKSGTSQATAISTETRKTEEIVARSKREDTF